MEVLTIGVALVAFIVGNIVTFRMFLGRRNNGHSKTGAILSSLIGFAVMIGIMAVYLLAGHLIWRIFS
jgi:hypothetical protein